MISRIIPSLKTVGIAVKYTAIAAVKYMNSNNKAKCGDGLIAMFSTVIN